jgi:hypothetical protein
MLDAVQPNTMFLWLEDPQPSCLTIDYAIPIYPSFWGAGANRPSTKE